MKDLRFYFPQNIFQCWYVRLTNRWINNAALHAVFNSNIRSPYWLRGHEISLSIISPHIYTFYAKEKRQSCLHDKAEIQLVVEPKIWKFMERCRASKETKTRGRRPSLCPEFQITSIFHRQPTNSFHWSICRLLSARTATFRKNFIRKVKQDNQMESVFQLTGRILLSR